MKYDNKNYISTGSLGWLLLPVICFTASITYCLTDTFHSRPADSYSPPRMNLVAERDTSPPDTPEFQTGDEALFNFTGDTVLVLTQPDSPAEFEKEVRVLHQTSTGDLETIDLPENWLVKLPADTLSE